MAILNSRKLITKKQKKHNAKLKNLPNHLLSEILVRVASTSFTDLFNAKKTCKQFLEAGSEDYIFKHVSIESFPVIPWKKNGAACFLAKCLTCENPESLFRQGMIEYFSRANSECGIRYLQRASEKGHVAAKYVYGVILVCYGGECRRRGLELFSGLGKSELDGVVKECRAKVKNIVRFMWVKNYITVKRRNCSCRSKSKNMRKKSSSWTNFEEFDDGVSCESCLWDIEAVRFCNMLRTGRFTSIL